MKLNINPRKTTIALIVVWAMLGIYFYTPLTQFVTGKMLEKFRPIAYAGETYSLTTIDKARFVAQNQAYSTLYVGDDYTIGSNVSVIDGRAAALRKYLRDQGSPLTASAEILVKEADAYKLDWRLVAGISGIESKFCRVTPADTNNCWGWRGGPGGSWQKFESFDVGVKVLTSRLALGYGTNLTPYDIEPTYCPPCAASGHSWAHAVTQFMDGMSAYLEKSRVNQ